MNNKELIDFANWLWDMDYLNINSQLPPFKNAETLANHYSKVKKLNIPVVSGLLPTIDQCLDEIDELGDSFAQFDEETGDETWDGFAISKENVIKLVQFAQGNNR